MTTLDRIKSELFDEAAPRPVMLLGAGASIKSGVPSAAGFAEMIARWAYIRDQGRSEHDQSVHRSDWLPWLKSFSWYDSESPPELQYPDLVAQLLTPREARMQFFVERVRAAPRPSGGYVALADLIAKGWLRTILTTNFDDLIEQACRANPRALLTTVRSAAESANITTTPRFAQLVFLHGTVEHYTDLNLTSETQHLSRELIQGIAPLLRDSPLVVIGYRGGESSIMRDLLIVQAGACNHYRHGIFWCVRRGTVLSPLVTELQEAIGGNFLVVEIEGFDEALCHLADGAKTSARVAARETNEQLPSPELQVTAEEVDRINWGLVESRIPLCASRLDLEASTDRQALIDLLLKLDLAGGDGPNFCLTVAGLRLLGQQANIQVVVRWALGERTFSGNIFELIDKVRDALAELNEPYRLKGPRSVDVRAFEPLALKELLVNALVHRDYHAAGPVRITLTVTDITFVSPGGVISTVDPERLGRPGVRGYRNQVIANVLYGTGDMDKLGSGLVDVRRWAQEGGADASFAVSSNNETFIARLGARPERPAGPGLPAEPRGSYEVFYANALQVRPVRGAVDIAPCKLSDRRIIWDRHPGVGTSPFLLRAGQLITLDDLRDGPAAILAGDCQGPAETLALDDYCITPDGERHMVHLLNESLGRHAKDLGLVVDWNDDRLWYPRSKDGDGSVEVGYQGRIRHATRTVVKVRKSADGDPIYFEHSALAWQFRRLGGDWYLFLLPGWAFTKDGSEQQLPPRRVTSLSTRRAARDYNANVSAHLFFWAYVLTQGQDELILRDGGSTVALAAQPVTTHMAGMPATPGTGEPSEDDLDDEDDGYDGEDDELDLSGEVDVE
jgi:NAD-dependent SIR2 family protein deacetylase